MRKFFTALIVIPLFLTLVVFAVANRHLVTVSFDPFNATDPALAISLPLFALIIMVAIIGVVAGGSAVWFGQRRWRRAARRHEADARAAKAHLEALRAQAQAQAQPMAMRGAAPRLSAPLQGRLYGASGRDKHGATL
ncbi:MAG: DUF1049 domain-containing protein [Bradyrhizobium sp.]|uniref:lipopolysaccharide assembly protein LapA domain-containing protein n=1 Tax=Bradyrhizobium sp. TaxID=376 RepID=UPI001D207C3C|nr:lipopolysaccharide assembly protein LapA domain-containing protein [Bradyrhizobium sp.]MBV9564730.1 DUF1049 domain-containing protein [Bradyrhizobium sp.]